mmetsp:Transcript_120805/g.276954  ORF Transcript_120805/g.276954 Transcript_120805/m.276954 type:complete len:216 (-) Transcript_120805:325-972(-)
MRHQCSYLCHDLKLKPSAVQMAAFCRSGSVTSWAGSDQVGSVTASVCDIGVKFTDHLNVLVRWRSLGSYSKFEVAVCTHMEAIFMRQTDECQILVEKLAPRTLHTVYVRGVTADETAQLPGSLSFHTPDPDAAAAADTVSCSSCFQSVTASDTVAGTFSSGAFFCKRCEPNLHAEKATNRCGFCGGRFEFSTWEVRVLCTPRPEFCSKCRKGEMV